MMDGGEERQLQQTQKLEYLRKLENIYTFKSANISLRKNNIYD
jgi:hypothetical protein